MELKIDLNSREEIDAAISLLQLIAGSEECSPAAVKRDWSLPVTQSLAEVATALGNIPTAQDLGRPLTASEAETLKVPPGPVETDSKGLPWDSRIHASTKRKNADGTWTAKRGVDAATVATVTAELSALSPPAPEVQQAQPDPAAVFGGQPVTPPAPPAPPVSDDPVSFEQLMPRVTAAVAGGKLPATALNASCIAHGLPSIVALQQQPQYVPLVWAALKSQMVQ